MSSIEDRVAELEAQLAQLQARSVPPGYSPLNGITVDAAGNVTYDFDGHVHAQGIDLDAGVTDDPLGDSRVRWVRTTDGAIVGDVSAFSRDVAATQQGSVVLTVYGAVEDDAAVQLVAANTDPNDRTAIEIAASGAIGLQAYLQQALLLDAGGNSDYLLGVRGITTINMGSREGAQVVPHGLGVVPFVLATPVAGGSLLFGLKAVVSAYDTDSFELTASIDTDVPGDFTGGTVDISWIALK